ncbi:MAG: ABC transporter ATP-binding protein [Thermodesulfobacteriota bacterium]|jgi:branched-chain amino acid transport system ATP-binding protein
MAKILEIENVSKFFGGLEALKDVCFDVQENELLSIIGPNGSGKTTLFNLITGVYRVSGGSIIFKGQPVHNEKSNRIAERGIARTFQNIKLFHTLSVMNNVLIASYCKGRPQSWAQIFGVQSGIERDRKLKEKSRELIKFVGLKGKEDDVVSNLAYGEQKKTEIARALALNPELLLLDEPVGGLNPAERQEITHLIRTILKEGVTVLLIEHDMRVVMNISERIIALNFGQIIAEGKPEEIRRNGAVIEAYFGPEMD